tara:strand:+ start:561 stop:680 length:120 start_codon:yes stop_codon:yes gene_type:complete
MKIQICKVPTRLYKHACLIENDQVEQLDERLVQEQTLKE